MTVALTVVTYRDCSSDMMHGLSITAAVTVGCPGRRDYRTHAFQSKLIEKQPCAQLKCLQTTIAITDTACGSFWLRDCFFFFCLPASRVALHPVH